MNLRGISVDVLKSLLVSSDSNVSSSASGQLENIRRQQRSILVKAYCRLMETFPFSSDLLEKEKEDVAIALNRINDDSLYGWHDRLADKIIEHYGKTYDHDDASK